MWRNKRALVALLVSALLLGCNDGKSRNDVVDADGDSIPDSEDLCPTVNDPLQGDADSDGIGDSCEPASWQDFVWDGAVWQ